MVREPGIAESLFEDQGGTEGVNIVQTGLLGADSCRSREASVNPYRLDISRGGQRARRIDITVVKGIAGKEGVACAERVIRADVELVFAILFVGAGRKVIHQSCDPGSWKKVRELGRCRIHR